MKRVVGFLILLCTASVAFGQVPHLPPLATSPYTVKFQAVATGLQTPSDVVEIPGSHGKLVIPELNGITHLVNNGVMETTPFLDISTLIYGDPHNYGLTSIAFNPGFNVRGSPGYHKVYTMSPEAPYAAPANYGFGGDHQEVIYEWKVSASNPNVVDMATQREILRVDQPKWDHNMDKMAFGPDGNMYISLGDGGSEPNYSTNSQLTSQIYGKLLRINVTDQRGNGRYSIPSSNPFARSRTEMREVYAYGFRNPYRFSFDRATGELYVGDVGQYNIEEVDRVTKGANYGWPLKEGTFVYDPNTYGVAPDVGDAVAIANGLTDPLGEYDHTQGSSTIGGFVYRGSLMPQLQGKYIFGDFNRSWTGPNGFRGRLMEMDTTTGVIRSLQISTAGLPLDFFILGMGEDAHGELYVTGRLGLDFIDTQGLVVKLVPDTAAIPEPASALLLAGAIMLLPLRRSRKN